MHRARLAIALLALLIAHKPTETQSPDSTVGRRRIQALPAFGSAPETGIQYGATVFAVTYGAGLRVQIDPAQRTAVRADYGRGRDGNSGLYIGFNQAF